jgi:hypothetical protein
MIEELEFFIEDVFVDHVPKFGRKTKQGRVGGVEFGARKCH